VINSRKAHRFRVELPTELTLCSQIVTLTMTNLSLGGACLAMANRVPLGTFSRLRFSIPAYEQAIVVDGEFRWCHPPTAGVQFAGLRAREVWELNRWFETLERVPPGATS
jgi:hypothetical protein